MQKTMDVNTLWTSIDLVATETTPLIGYGPFSYNGIEPGVIRLRETDIESGQIEMRIQEYQYLDGVHLLESIDIMAFTEGVQTLDDGTMIVVGSFHITGNGQWEMNDFPVTFDGIPHVFLFAQSALGGDAKTLYIKNISVFDFEVTLKEEEQLMLSGHLPEKIAYYAIYSPNQQGTLMIGDEDVNFSLQQIEVDHQWTEVPGTAMEIKLEEEQSQDQEVNHTIETVDVLILGDQLYTQSVTNHGPDPFSIRKRQTNLLLTIEGDVEDTNNN
jgi:hypothetical protein